MSLSAISVNSVFRRDKFEKSDDENKPSACGNNGALLDMLAEVASQKLYNEIIIKKKHQHKVHYNSTSSKHGKKKCNKIKSYDKDVAYSSTRSCSSNKKYPPYCQSGGRGLPRYSTMTGNQVRSLSASQLVRLFTVLEGDEMKKTFYFQCQFLPNCQERFFSFGGEEKARHLVKQHLNKHVQLLSSDSIIEVPHKYEPLNKKISSSVKNFKKMSVTKVNGSSNNISSCVKDKHKGMIIEIGEEKISKTLIKERNEIEMDEYYEKYKKIEERPKPQVLIIETSLKKTNDIPFPSNLTRPSQISLLDQPHEELPKINNDASVSSNGNNDMIRDHNYYRYLNTTGNYFNGNCTIKDVKMEIKNDKTVSCASDISSAYVYSNSTSFCKQPIVPNVCNDVPDLNCADVNDSTDLKSGLIVKEVPVHDSVNDDAKSYVTLTPSQNVFDETCDYLMTPVVQEVVVETDNFVEKNFDANGVASFEYESQNVKSKVLSSDGEGHIEFDSASQDDVFKSSPIAMGKKPKGKAKFIGQSAEEREMAVEMIKALKRDGGGLECQICQPKRVFTAPTTLISHYRSHAGIKPYECLLCKAVFTRQHSLNYHLLIHLNQTRFTCDECGRKFRHPSHFKEHQRRHTGESPFECPDCTMRFKTRNTYKRHLKTRHGKILTHSGAIITVAPTTPLSGDAGLENRKEGENEVITKEIKTPSSRNSDRKRRGNSNVSKAVVINCSINNNNNELDKENNGVAIVGNNNNNNNVSREVTLSTAKPTVKRAKLPIVRNEGVDIKITKQNQMGGERGGNTGAVFLNILPTLQQQHQQQVLQNENAIAAGKTAAVLLLTNNYSNTHSFVNDNIVNDENVFVENCKVLTSSAEGIIMAASE